MHFALIYAIIFNVYSISKIMKNEKFVCCNYKSTISYIFSILLHTLRKQRLKVTQLEKARFIKVNELKLTQVELF